MAKQTTTTEIQIIPAELSPVLKDTKIELSKAESHAMAFAPSMASYIELADKIKGMDKTNPSETDAKIARENRLKMVKVRTGAEEIKDLRKEGIKAEGDLIQALFNVVKNSCLVTENEFTEIEKHQERIEAKRQAELAETRRSELVKYDVDTEYLPLNIMTDEQYQRCLDNGKIAFESRVAAAEKLEAERIENERLAEVSRLAAIEADRIAREEQAKENERLRVENEAKEKQLQAEREAAAKENQRLADIAEAARKENAAIAEKLAKENVAKLAEQQRLAKIEQDKADKLRAELQAKQAAEDARLLAEKQRIEAEEADRLAKEKAALNANDKEKVRVLHTALKAIEIPVFTTAEGIAIGKTMKEALDILIKGLVQDSKKLL